MRGCDVGDPSNAVLYFRIGFVVLDVSSINVDIDIDIDSEIDR